MTVFSVWAPNAKRVQLLLTANDERLPMEVGEDGWFSLDVPEAGPGTRYQYIVDKNAPMPDPRSMYQPEGVHGPSEVVDQASFAWTDSAWRGIHLPSAVIYEMHVGTFTPDGTFESAIDKLDHLVELGITAVELLPVVEFPGNHGWGYDGVDLFAPHHAYGGPEGLKLFTDAAHRKGLGVIIDVVYNHFGPDGNYLGEYGPYFTDTYSTPWGDAVNYDDTGSDEVRRFVVDNALMWLRDYHVDGLRLDAVHAIYDKSAVHILEQLATEVEFLAATLGRNKFLIAESDLNAPHLVQERAVGGYGMDAQWSDDFHHALHATLTGEDSGYYGDYDGLDAVVAALQDTFVYVGQYQPSRGRSHGRPPIGIPAWRFLGYLQNHDQIGNRAKGERSPELMTHGRVKAGAAIVALSPFVPMFFQGEEWGASTPFQYFTDHEEELGNLVREGRREEFSAFGWDPEDIPDPQSERTFLDSKLNWDEIEHPSHTDVYEWHRALIGLRRSTAALNDGGADIEAWAEDDVLTVVRSEITLVVNLGDEAIEGDFDGELLLGSSPEVALDDGSLIVPPDGVAILRAG